MIQFLDYNVAVISLKRAKEEEEEEEEEETKNVHIFFNEIKVQDWF